MATIVIPAEIPPLMKKYYTKKVAAKTGINEKNFDFVDQVARELLEYINLQDPRFKAEPTLFGSHHQGLICGKSQQFRYGVKVKPPKGSTWINRQLAPYTPRMYSFNKQPWVGLDIFGNVNPPNPTAQPLNRILKGLEVVHSDIPVPNPEYQHGFLKLGSVKGWKDLSMHGDLVPYLVKRRFMQLVKEARTAMQYEDIMTISSDVTRSHITVTLQKGGSELSLDLDVMIEMGLEQPDYSNWPRPQAQWPTPAKMAKVEAVGMNLRATGSFHWRESYAEMRRELIKSMDIDQAQRKKVFRIIKQLNIQFWCNPRAKPNNKILCVELKNLWFWEAEMYPSTASWQGNEMTARVISMASRLLGAINTMALPHYFDQRRNLFEDKSPSWQVLTAQRVQHFITNPGIYFSQV